MTVKATEIFFEIHKDLPREGPGSFGATKKAYDSICPSLKEPLILDIGCGPGKQTHDLLKITDGKIIAVDNHKPFIDRLNNNIRSHGFEDRASAQLGDMFNLQFKEDMFDLIWSEGAIYQIGFEKGLREFKKFLKPNGFMAVTEVSWVIEKISSDAADFWAQEYPAMKSVEENLEIVKNCGYEIVNHFILDKSDWFNDYYTPMKPRLEMIKEKYSDDETAKEVIRMHELEIEILELYYEEYGYVFYILHNKNNE